MNLRPLTLIAVALASLVATTATAQIHSPETARPGDPVVLTMAGGHEATVTIRGPEGIVGDPVRSFRIDLSPQIAISCVVIGLSSTVEPGDYVLDVQSSDGNLVDRRPLRVIGRDFRREEISLSSSLTELRESQDPRKTTEALHLQAIVAEFNPSSLFHPGLFVWPIELTRRTSLYGDRRTYVYADGGTAFTIHLGTDLAAPTGTPVAASGNGLVRMARSRIVTGNSVVIEHLPGVFSLYYHLDEMFVEEGTTVAVGQTIGTSGATGLATGPHLHWEFRIGGVSVDPEAMLNQPLVDFDL